VDLSRPTTKIADLPAGSTNVSFSFDIGSGNNFVDIIPA
jgi:hypothetical protein